jgi:hypothetical protein
MIGAREMNVDLPTRGMERADTAARRQSPGLGTVDAAEWRHAVATTGQVIQGRGGPLYVFAKRTQIDFTKMRMHDTCL